MANEDQLRTLRQGVDVWNKWRRENPDAEIDLNRADLHSADLTGADLCGANLREAYLPSAKLMEAKLMGAKFSEAWVNFANLSKADLSKADLGYVWLMEADLSGADLSKASLMGGYLNGANLSGANLSDAELHGAILREANLNETNLSRAKLIGADLKGTELFGANLTGADLTDADLNCADLTDGDLTGADLSRASLVETTLVGTKLTGCRIYGISAWGLKIDDKTKQRDLIITPHKQSTITIDDLEVAQFVYFLLYNPNFRRVIDTMTSKAVLILGSFTDDRKPTLYAIKDELRRCGYVPIIYDFKGSANRTTQETITLIARLARFVIADITDPKSIIQEISAMTNELRCVPIKPILLTGHEPWGMYDHPRRCPWLLPIYEYRSTESLIASFKENVLDPLEGWLKENLRSV